ncbi:acyl-CoA dehydrogenase family protein [bacterium]|nr:acyl-CoA dehydrogenase family protein [bacterium]
MTTDPRHVQGDAIRLGRDDLLRWDESKPHDFYESNPLLKRILARFHGGDIDENAFSEFGRLVAGPINLVASENDRAPHLPHVERFDGLGTRIEEIVFSPLYHAAGKPAYDAGIISCLAEPGNIWFQSVLFYLLGHAGEMGHLCPITCTSGMVRALQQKGSAELKERWLPGLLTPIYEDRLHGSQFLTEVQGGSDVGANAVRAVPDGENPGAFRVYGEKWFCSVADAALFLITARPENAPEGTSGLGCFLVPRRLDDGSINNFVVRRLKDKIGTRTLATAEIDFEGSLAWPVGEIDEGFRIAVGIVLNTSRFMNALGCASCMRRAYVEAASYARYRKAFGHAIATYPLVRETLSIMKSEEAGALVTTFFLAEIIDRMDRGEASREDEMLYRVLVNANKYWTSIIATDVTHRGVEILGGNGTIETFSILPRLYRDAIVLESWEGSHNVLCMQVLRDIGRFGIIPVIDAKIRGWLAAADDVESAATVALSAWERTRAGLDRCVADPVYGQMHIRRHIESMMAIIEVGLLYDQSAWETGQGLNTETAVMADLLAVRRLDPAYRAEDDEQHLFRFDRILANDPVLHC